MEILKEFYRYLNHPVPVISHQEGLGEQLANTLKLFAVVFGISMFLLMPLMTLAGVENMDHKMADLLENTSYLFIAFMAVVMAPLLEEFIFRFPLKYRSLAFILNSILIGSLMFFFLQIFVSFYWTYIVVGLFAVLRIVQFISMWNNESVKEKSENSFLKNYPYFFYAVAFVFAFVHITNFDLTQLDWWFTPILVGPQLLLGLLLGFVRIKYGIWHSILVHACNNAIPITVMILFGDILPQ